MAGLARKELGEMILVVIIIAVTAGWLWAATKTANQSTRESYLNLVANIERAVNGEDIEPFAYYIDQGFFLEVCNTDNLCLCEGRCSESQLMKRRFEKNGAYYSIEIKGNYYGAITGDAGMGKWGNRDVGNVVIGVDSNKITITDCSKQSPYKDRPPCAASPII